MRPTIYNCFLYFTILVLNASAFADDTILVLENFSDNKVGSLPKNWKSHSSEGDRKPPYQIKQEKGKKFLSAQDNGESVSLAKEVDWDINKYPYISFKWRATQLPKGGDARRGDTADNGVSVSIIYKKILFKIPQQVKYVWSTTLPVASAFQRRGIGRPWIIVAESGSKNLGSNWRTYTFNAKEAYSKTFGGKPPKNPLAIVILSDANNTKSKAFGDYSDIVVMKSANTDSGIKKILKLDAPVESQDDATYSNGRIDGD